MAVKKTLEQNAADLRKSVQRLLKIKDGTVTSTTRLKLEAALRSLGEGDKGLAVSWAAMVEATDAITQYVLDNTPTKSGPYTGGAVGDQPGAGTLEQGKSIYPNDAAGVRQLKLPVSVRRAMRELLVLQLRQRS